jgi:hypothetical protein
MNQADILTTYQAATTVLSLIMLVAAVVMFWLQMRAYRRTRHRSLEPLLFSSGLAGGHTLLSMAAQHYWLSSPLGFYIFLFSLPVALLQIVLGTYGTARLLHAFEEQAAVGGRYGP